MINLEDWAMATRMTTVQIHDARQSQAVTVEKIEKFDAEWENC